MLFPRKTLPKQRKNVDLDNTSNDYSISESKYLNFIDAIKICYKRSFDYESRATRSEFWWFWLYCFVILILTIVASENNIEFLSILFKAVVVCNIIPGIAVRVRRLRDVGTNGWWILGWPIGIIRILLFFEFMGESDYGENECSVPQCSETTLRGTTIFLFFRFTLW